MDFTKLKLGKKPVKHDPRTLKMANYLTLPKIPKKASWSAKMKKPYGMMTNDRLGSCTCAAMGHGLQGWTANASQQYTTPDSVVIDAYSAVSGYNPSDPSTDRGAYCLDVMNYWRKTGLGGRKITAYVGAEPHNVSHIRAGIYLFGGCYIGLDLPLSAQGQAVWSVPPGGPTGRGRPGSWGGHAVWVINFGPKGPECITWGEWKRMTWAFWAAYTDEAYVALSSDWIKASGMSPSKFNVDQLMADLALIT